MFGAGFFVPRICLSAAAVVEPLPSGGGGRGPTVEGDLLGGGILAEGRFEKQFTPLRLILLTLISVGMVWFVWYLQVNYPPVDPKALATGPPAPVDWSPYGGLAWACIAAVVIVDVITIVWVMRRQKDLTHDEKRPFGPTQKAVEATTEIAPSNRIEQAVAKRALPKEGAR